MAVPIYLVLSSFRRLEWVTLSTWSAFENILLPLAYEYNPQLVLVCCGFDSAINDPKVFVFSFLSFVTN